MVFSVSAFNQQVKRNTQRFPDGFLFELSHEEMIGLSKSQNIKYDIDTDGKSGHSIKRHEGK